MSLDSLNHPFFTAARLERSYPIGRIRPLKRLAGVAAAAFGAGAFITAGDAIFAVALFCLSAWWVLVLWARFLSFYEGTSITPLPASIGHIPAGIEKYWPWYLDFSTAVVFSGGGGLPAEAGFSALESPPELLGRIFSSPFGDFFFLRTGIERRAFLGELERAYPAGGPPAFRFSDVLAAAVRSSASRGHRALLPADFLSAIAAIDRTFSRLLIAHGLAEKDLDYLGHWFSIAGEHHRPKSFTERLAESAGVGKTWAYGYTPFVDRVSAPIRAASGDELHVVAHKKAIGELEEALARSEAANAMVIGEPGVGKMSVVKGFADRVAGGRSFPSLNYRRVRRLEMEEIVGEPAGGGIAANFERLFGEVGAAGHLILIIEDIELYLGPGAGGAAAEAILPFLRSPRVKVIGLTTPAGYTASLGAHSSIGPLFAEIRLEEPDEETVMLILIDAALAAEQKYGVRIDYPVLKKVYESALHYLAGTPFPEKAITLLEETILAAGAAGAAISPEAVSQVLARKFGAVAGAVGEGERSLLVDLEAKLSRRVVEQGEAIRAIADAIRRKRAGVASGSKPVGTFLFMGPTGVGKTETAKALAEVYFGSEERMIRLDMAEFQNPGDIGRLIGSPAENAAGRLASEIRAHPFSLLLLDEIEKAHSSILNLFLRILDEGRATDAFGKPIDFTNAIIIGASNAGSEFIRQALAAGMSYPDLQRQLVDTVLRERIFLPEFLNRFDAVIVYTPLAPTAVRRVAELLLKDLEKRIEAQGYSLVWSPAALDWLVEKGYSPVFGGRELRRVMQDTIEASIAKDILAGKYRKGETIAVAVPSAEVLTPAAPPAPVDSHSPTA